MNDDSQVDGNQVIDNEHQVIRKEEAEPFVLFYHPSIDEYVHEEPSCKGYAEKNTQNYHCSCLIAKSLRAENLALLVVILDPP